MAKLNASPQLSRQDFPQAPDWISKLLYPLQLFMTNVLQALTNNLTFQDNFSCVVHFDSITAAASNTLSFTCVLNRQPVELTIHAVRADGTYEVMYPQASWNFINNQIVVNGISGLTSGKQYLLTFVVK